MRAFKLSILFFISALFLTACNRAETEQAIIEQNAQLRAAQDAIQYDAIPYNRLAMENLDLQAIGQMLEDAESAEEFEYRLNSPENGINNLDLNGDGYVDYISVREFDDRYDDERGFSLFSMFGPELIQEIATIVFDRDRYDNGDYYPGSRVLITGNDQIYGDNYYYETNWLDRTVPIVSWIFTDRDGYYNSPYYYQNYPTYYEPYTVVETTVYRTRIEQYYTEPVFIQTAQPTITQVKIKSPYRDKSLEKIYPKLAKPTREQVEFSKNNPKPPEFVRQRNDKIKDANFKPEKPFRDKPNKVERQENFKPERPQQQMRDKPNKPEQPRVKFERQNQVRVERQQPKVERQRPVQQVQRQQPQQQVRQQPQMKPQKQANPGGGGGKGNGGGGGNGKGNGGGGGKKGKG